MNVFRNPEVQQQTILHLAVSLVGFVICLPFSAAAAVLLLTVSVVTLGISLWFHRRRYTQMAQLTRAIDRILHGMEQITLEDFCEGELSILATEIHKMTIRLREQNTMLQRDRSLMKESTEDMAHQLRTPLTSMLLLADALGKPGLNDRDKTMYLREMHRLMERMQWQIDTMLGLARMEAGAVQLQKTKILCKQLIRRAVEPLLISMELKEIEWQVQIEGSPWFYGDLRYCTEAVTNLLKNCLEHTPSGGIISVTAEQNTAYTVITITDNGEGIPEEQLAHLFDRFYRVSDFAKKGYGIGLAFAAKTVALQEGTLQVRNAKPHGAQFELRMYRTII